MKKSKIIFIIILLLYFTLNFIRYKSSDKKTVREDLIEDFATDASSKIQKIIFEYEQPNYTLIGFLTEDGSLYLSQTKHEGVTIRNTAATYVIIFKNKFSQTSFTFNGEKYIMSLLPGRVQATVNGEAVKYKEFILDENDDEVYRLFYKKSSGKEKFTFIEED